MLHKNLYISVTVCLTHRFFSHVHDTRMQSSSEGTEGTTEVNKSSALLNLGPPEPRPF